MNRSIKIAMNRTIKAEGNTNLGVKVSANFPTSGIVTTAKITDTSITFEYISLASSGV